MSSLSRNESKAEKDRQKQIQDRCQALLNQMLRDEDNKYCVDCDAKGPRWASWNLGIFLCIRCAGIHRNLGVHISKVKSVNLDSWTPEQVVSLQQMGNSRARAVYEATLPDSWRRPQTDSSLESFIRAKYQHKKYIAKEWVQPPLPKVDWDKELDEEAERQKKRKKEKPVQTVVKKPISETTVPALPKPNSSPKASRTKTTENTSKGSAVDLLGLNSPTSTASPSSTAINNNSDDVFSNFLSAPTTTSSSPRHDANSSQTPSKTEDGDSTSKRRSAEEESFFNQPTPSTEKKQLSKDSILALYGSSNQQQTMFTNPGLFQQPMNTFQQPNVYSNGVSQMYQSSVPALGSNPFFNMCSGQMPNQYPLQVIN
ncbi:UNVERIFIED_CONTAM: hypothetical protein PYX00_004920 [Menopon gallinae]|uniref:Arf-GAP domain-containing protein n=1 Tax=Menopon gallinae TaxID=328185 RepID=A0AAW2I8E9_9NEOP